MRAQARQPDRQARNSSPAPGPVAAPPGRMPPALTPSLILELQRNVGNHAASRAILESGRGAQASPVQRAPGTATSAQTPRGPVEAEIRKIAEEFGDRKGGKTKGQVINISGAAVFKQGDPIESSESGAAKATDEFLREKTVVPYPEKAKYGHPSAAHVEAKVAYRMREREIRRANIVINHEQGPCDGEYGCQIAVPAILPPGSALIVWFIDTQGRLQNWPLEGYPENHHYRKDRPRQ